MLLSLVLWIYGGGQKGFYKNFYVVEKFDEIMEVSYPVEVKAFLPGIETLALGFTVFVVLMALSVFVERKESSPKS